MIGFAFLNTVINNVEYFLAKAQIMSKIPTLKDADILNLTGILAHTPKSITLMNTFDLATQNYLYDTIKMSYKYGFEAAIALVLCMSILTFFLTATRIRVQRST